MPGFVFAGDRRRHFVRPGLPARGPQDHEAAALNHLHREHREVGRLYQLASCQQFLLDLVELIGCQARGRKDRLPVRIAVLPDHHIAAAEVFKVVGKSANCAQHGIRIPTRLVLNALTFHPALVQEIIEVDGQFVRHRSPPLLSHCH